MLPLLRVYYKKKFLKMSRTLNAKVTAGDLNFTILMFKAIEKPFRKLVFVYDGITDGNDAKLIFIVKHAMLLWQEDLCFQTSTNHI